MLDREWSTTALRDRQLSVWVREVWFNTLLLWLLLCPGVYLSLRSLATGTQ